MKASIPGIAALLFAWMIGGYFVYNNTCCGTVGAAATGTSSSSLFINDGGTDVAFAKNSDLLFALSSSKPNMSKSVSNEFAKVANYLKEHPHKLLLLTGLHKENEKNDTDLLSLGLSRAEALKAGLVKRGVPEEQIITDTEVYNDLDMTGDNQIIGGMKYYFKSKFLSLTDGSNFDIGVEDNLNFERDNSKFMRPLSDPLSEYFSKVVTYMNGNPDKSLMLTGLYGADEENNSLLPNIGLARAQEVKRMLMDMGIKEDQLMTDAEEISLGFFQDNNLTGGVDFSISVKEAGEERSEDTGYEDSSFDINKPIILYFETSQKKFDLSDEDDQIIADLVNYVNNNAGTQLTVIGHTDNDGSEKTNMEFGLKRARVVRDYLLKQGLTRKQVVRSSKGASEPIATNSTEEGKAKNRRVEIKIYQKKS